MNKFRYQSPAEKYNPIRASVHAAGFDLSACINPDYLDKKSACYTPDIEYFDWIKIVPGERVKIDTGLKVAIPNGYYGRVAPRSGLALRAGIDVLAGVIDSDYRGHLVVILINHGKSDFIVRDGDRIAQLIIEKIYDSDGQLVNNINEDETERGAGGFGSTGVGAINAK